MPGGKRRRTQAANAVPAQPKSSIHERDIAGVDPENLTYTLLWHIATPPLKSPVIRLPAIDTNIIHEQMHATGFEPSEEKILLLLRSGTVLPLLFAFAKDCKRHGIAGAFGTLMHVEQVETIQRIGQAAVEISQGEEGDDEVVNLFARHTWLLANKTHDVLINTFGASADRPQVILAICAAVLLTLMNDLVSQPDGFFSLLLKSDLAWPMDADCRCKWEKLFLLPINQTGIRLPDVPLHPPIFKIGPFTPKEEIIHQRACEYLVYIGPLPLSSLARLFVYRNGFELLQHHQANEEEYAKVKVVQRKLEGQDESWNAGRGWQLMMPSTTPASIDRQWLARYQMLALQASILEVAPDGEEESFPQICARLAAKKIEYDEQVKEQARQDKVMAMQRTHKGRVQTLKKRLDGLIEAKKIQAYEECAAADDQYAATQLVEAARLRGLLKEAQARNADLRAKLAQSNEILNTLESQEIMKSMEDQDYVLEHHSGIANNSDGDTEVSPPETEGPQYVERG